MSSPALTGAYVDASTFHADVQYLEALWRRIPVGDIDLPVIDIGEGEPLVFVPILEHLEFVYARQVRAFSQARRVILYRRQENRTSSVGLAERAAELLRVLDSLGLEKVDLVGHGDGAMVLFEFALRYPERCRSLTIIAQAADYEIAPHPFIWLLHELFLRLPVEHLLPAWFLRRIVINYIVAQRPSVGAGADVDEGRGRLRRPRSGSREPSQHLLDSERDLTPTRGDPSLTPTRGVTTFRLTLPPPSPVVKMLRRGKVWDFSDVGMPLVGIRPPSLENVSGSGENCPQLPRELIEEQFRKIALWPFVYKFSVLPIIHSFDIRQHLQRLTMPILLINRPDDVLSPEAKTRWLAQQLPNCVGYHVIAGGERFFMYARAEEVNQLMAAFLEGKQNQATSL